MMTRALFMQTFKLGVRAVFFALLLGAGVGASPCYAGEKSKLDVGTDVDVDSEPVGGVVMDLAEPVVLEGVKSLSEREAEAAYDAARRASAAGGVASSGGVGDAVVNPEVIILENPVQRTIAGGKDPANVALSEIRVVVDVENTTLRDVFAEIVTQAAQYTGPWIVKWRLKPENMSLLDERVNLTAEAPFNRFVELLTERVRNMGGVQLFVTAFGESRILLVTDTYY